VRSAFTQAELSRAAVLYLGAIISIAVFLPLARFANSPDHSLRSIILFCAIAVGVWAASSTPLTLAAKTKLYLDGTVVLAAIILLDTTAAMLAVGLGMIVAQTVRRVSWDQALFNASLSALLTGIGGLLFGLGTAIWGAGPLAIIGLGVGATAAMLVLNILILAPMIAIQTREQIATVTRSLWVDAIWDGRRTHLAQSSVAIAMASLVALQPLWILGLLVALVAPHAPLLIRRSRQVTTSLA